jgi:crotonobetainyl-CoA:carnitine CoA-transferase CaiB-like acyl-CoA transferase
MRLTIEHPVHGPIDVLGFPIKFSEAPCRIHRPPPELGADNEAVLGELGYSAAAIAELRTQRVI